MQHHYHVHTSSLKAIGIVCFAWFSYSVADALAKFLVADYSFAQILVISSFIGWLVTGTWILSARGLRGFFSKKIGLHLTRAVSNAIVTVTVVPALGLIPLADFYGIIFTAPLTVLILLSLFLKETIGWRRWAAVAVGFGGVILLSRPHFETVNAGILLAMVGAFFIAINIVLIRRIGTGEFTPVYGFYAFSMIFILNAVILFYTGGLILPDTGDIALFLFHAVFVLFGQIFFAAGFARAPEAAVVTPFHYTQMIWGILFGYLFFQDVPTAETIAGLIIIMLSGLFIIFRERRLAHLSQNAK
jgi:S-adenosylmethionine uptake transporter